MTGVQTCALPIYILGRGAIEPGFDAARFTPLLTRYLQSMGVSGGLAALADATPSNDIRLLSREELSRLRVMTPRQQAKRRT